MWAVSYGHGRVQSSCSSHLRAFCRSETQALAEGFPSGAAPSDVRGAGRDRRPTWSSGYGGRDSRHKTQNGLGDSPEEASRTNMPDRQMLVTQVYKSHTEHRTSQTAMSQPQPASPESSDVNAATLSAVLRAARNIPATHTEHVAAAVCGHDPERILAAAARRGKCAALVVTALGADLAAGSVLGVLDYRSCPPWLRLATPPSDLLERHANEQTDGIDLSDAAAGHRRRRTFVEAVNMSGLPTTVLATVAAHPQPWARAAAAANRHTPRWLLRRLAGDDDKVVRRAATANHAIPSAWLYSHAATGEIATQRKIAQNPRCDPMTLWMLADHTQTRVREYVALNESWPISAAAAPSPGQPLGGTQLRRFQPALPAGSGPATSHRPLQLCADRSTTQYRLTLRHSSRNRRASRPSGRMCAAQIPTRVAAVNGSGVRPGTDAPGWTAPLGSPTRWDQTRATATPQAVSTSSLRALRERCTTDGRTAAQAPREECARGRAKDTGYRSRLAMPASIEGGVEPRRWATRSTFAVSGRTRPACQHPPRRHCVIRAAGLPAHHPAGASRCGASPDLQGRNVPVAGDRDGHCPSNRRRACSMLDPADSVSDARRQSPPLEPRRRTHPGPEARLRVSDTSVSAYRGGCRLPGQRQRRSVADRSDRFDVNAHRSRVVMCGHATAVGAGWRERARRRRAVRRR